MTTGGPPAALSMRPSQPPITPVPATPPRARSGQATVALSHHTRNHTQRPTPPSKVALVRSWLGRTKIYLGAAIGLLTLIVTIVSLLPSFAGGRYGKETLELAMWTARKDYVEACQTYLNHTNVDCQQALEKGLPPPPGLDRLAARSLQKLKDHVQWLELQPKNHELDDHVVWLRLWLQIGTIAVALILTGHWHRFIRLVRRQWIKPWFRGQADDLAWSTRDQKGKTIGKSEIFRAPDPSQATSTGISVEEGHDTKLRRRTKMVASEAITLPASGLAEEHLRARNRAIHPVGKERVEKERRRRDREETRWTKAFNFRSARLNEVNPSIPSYPLTRRQLDFGDRTHDLIASVSKVKTPEYFDMEFGYVWEESRDFGVESFDSLEVAEEFNYEDVRPARRPGRLIKAVAAKQAQRRNRGIIACPRPIPRREKRNSRKGKRGFLYSDPFDDLTMYDYSVPY